MAWQLTESLDEFERAAWAHLHADPVRHTVPLSVLANLRHAGLSRYGADPPVFGWHQRPDGTVDGAVLQTPPFPLLVASLPTGSASELIGLLAAEHGLPSAVNIARKDEGWFVAEWAEVTGGTGTVVTRSRLYRLRELTPPDPEPPGTARLATQADLDVLTDWHEAFRAETQADGPADMRAAVADKVSHGGVMLWETGGELVAMAGLTRIEGGIARVAPVYTPPAHRRCGYGGAVTTAISAAALARGATGVVLFTDLANPTSNALYQRLGYRPVEDRVLLTVTAGPGVTTDKGTPSLGS